MTLNDFETRIPIDSTRTISYRENESHFCYICNVTYLGFKNEFLQFRVNNGNWYIQIPLNLIEEANSIIIRVKGFNV